MPLTDHIHDLIRAWEAGVLTFGEFQGQILMNLWKLPAAQKRAALDELSAHANEDVRKAAAELLLLARHEELSINFNYVKQNSPLRPGVRLELFDGYDYHSSAGKPWWLNGHDCYGAIFLGFVSCGENTIPAGLVEFDEPIALVGHKGRYGVLRAGCDSNSVAWAETEGVVAVHVVEALPEDPISIRSLLDPSHATETHATYRINPAP